MLGGGNYYNTGAYNTPNDNSGVATTPEIGTGTNAWTLLTGADSTTAFGAQNNRWWYPRGVTAPDGTVFGVSGDQMWRLTPTGTGSLTMLGTLPASIGVSGSAVMYAPGKILLAGGGQNFNQDSITATNAATTVDINGATPVVKAVAAMAAKRNWLNLTVLPNGEVFGNGGTITGTQSGAANSDYTAEIWNPTTQAWRGAATAQRIRTYHSTSLLMPSGAVFTGGGGVPGPEDNLNAEMYYPPSLFTRNAAGAVTWASRPTLTSIAGSLTWGGTLTLGTSGGHTVSSVSLITAATVTHSENTDQRRIPLTFTQSGDTLTVGLPATSKLAPPGSYLLQVVDDKGVPSPSQLVTFRNNAAGSVTVYEADQSGGQTGSTGGTPTGTVPLAIDSEIGLEPGNYQGYRVRHQNFAARIDPIDTTSPDVAKADSSLVVRTGLSGSGVSFEALNYPGYYLKVENGLVYLRKGDGSMAFAAAATFLAKTGLSGQNTSFVLASDQTLYLRHKNFVLTAQASDGSDLFRADATFAVRAGLGTAGTVATLTAGTGIGLESADYPGYLVRHQNFVGRVDKIGTGSSATAKSDSSFWVRAGLASGSAFSFESKNYPGYYLVADAQGTYLRKNDGSSAFATGATFSSRTGLVGRGTSFTLSGTPTLFLRKNGAALTTAADDGTAAFAADASFVPRASLA